MSLIGEYGVLFGAKAVDNALSTSKTILLQKSRWLTAGLVVMLSDFIYFWMTRRLIATEGNAAILCVAAAGGLGCILAGRINERFSRDRIFVNVIMSDNFEEMKKLRDYLAEHHITNVAADSYTRDWDRKTITVTAYPETKAESRLIRDYLAKRPCRFKCLIQPGIG